MKAPWRLTISALAILCASTGALASVLDPLTREQRIQIEGGESFVKTREMAGSSWPAVTVYRLVNATPEEAIAVFTDYEEQPSYLKDCCGVLRAQVLDGAVSGDRRVQRVRYELEVPVVSNERYELREEMTKSEDGTYSVTWKKVSRGGHSDDIVGSAVFEPYGGKTILRYSNFTKMSGFGAGLLSDQATERTRTTIEAMARHMEEERASGGPRFQANLARVRAALGE